MEPLKPDVKRSILANRPDAAPQDIQEYERLLAQRFTVDPDPAGGAPNSQARPLAAPENAVNTAEARLQELYTKLFG